MSTTPSDKTTSVLYWPEGPAAQAQFTNAIREILGLDPIPGLNVGRRRKNAPAKPKLDWGGSPG